MKFIRVNREVWNVKGIQYEAILIPLYKIDFAILRKDEPDTVLTKKEAYDCAINGNFIESIIDV